MITDEDISILPGFSPAAADLLRGLLQRYPDDRMDLQQVKEHRFFANINWESVLNK